MDEQTNNILNSLLYIKLYEYNLEKNKIYKEELKEKKYINLLDIKLAYQNIEKELLKIQRKDKVYLICKYYYELLTIAINHANLKKSLNSQEILFTITLLELLMDLKVSFPMEADKMYEKINLKENNKVIKYEFNK